MANGNSAERAAPEFRVRVNGSDLPPETATDIKNVAVHEDTDIPGMCTFDMVNWDPDGNKMKWSDSDNFKEGTAVEILVGFRDDLTKIFSGEITGLELKIHGKEAPQLRVRGYDRRHRLMRGQKTVTYQNMKDSAIASQVANKAGLAVDAEDTSVQHEHVFQHNQTDLEFLTERAARIHYEVAIDDKKLLFRLRKNKESEVLTLDRELDLLEFYPRLTTLNQVGEIGLRGWDPSKKEGIVSKSSAGEENTKMGGSSSGPTLTKAAFGSSAAVSVNRSVENQGEADQFAKARLNEMALSFITGDAVSIGKAQIRAGVVLKIVGMGKRFSGLYYVTSTIHTYMPSRGYRTAFSFRRNAT